ncbi:peptidoglycan DD-metalloendopeptidase family protein [Mediterraneibacter glycyrrhizinilyticus]|nr:M23 family metallopeptidase [Mediterraneibacter glycyrrhizinilyticus]MBM6853410.1 peptidoglycan DD-metalloendopeptidase family protein [Mediterraneibacter glycyrrhizinilyticus]
MKKRMKRVVGIILAFVMCAGMTLNAGAVTIDEAEDKADELEQQKESAEAEKEKLISQLNGIIDDMNETQEKLTVKEEEINAAEQELVQAKINENNQYESMKKRIKFMYEGGNTQFLEVLLQSQSIGDLLNKAEYVSQLSSYDRDMLTEFQNTVKEVEEKEAALQEEYSELNDLQDQLAEQQDQVQTLIDSKEAQIADIQDEIKANEATLEKLKKEAEEAKRLREEQAAAAAAGSGGSSYTPPSGGNVVSGNGYFTHPCPGMTYQSSYFGEIREFEVGGHKGNDYAAPVGTPTYAAAAGTVVIAGWSNSAGNWVVINHGNGLVTKYMHHSSLCVSTGQYVEKGQQIGYVGSTGQSTGPHLHFQVELNGVPVSPDSYM